MSTSSSNRLLNPEFPVIEHIDQVLEQIKGMPEMRVRSEAFNTRTVWYVFSDKRTFDTPWARECRGLTFDAVGKLISRPLHKFFNVGEKPWLMPEVIPYHLVDRVCEKLDGSMIHTVNVADRAELKSKASFGSDVAKLATLFMADPRRAKLAEFTNDCVNGGMTAVFEFTSPTARVVLKYDQPQMRLLHVRENLTGRYLTESEIVAYADAYDVPLVKSFPLAELAALRAGLATSRDIEGMVYQFPGGDMVKAKSAWYLALHGAISFLRPRQVAESVLDDNFDDLVAALVDAAAPQETLDRVHEIRETVVRDLLSINRSVQGLAAQMASLDLKSAAEKMKGHVHFNMVMGVLRGRDLRSREWYRDHVLKERWSLEQIQGFDLAEG